MAFTTTTKWALRRLTGGSLVSDVDAGFTALADDVDAKLTPYSAGLLASRPVSTPGSPGIAGRVYYVTEFGLEFRDTGTGWALIGKMIGEPFDFCGNSANPTPEVMQADGRALSRTTYATLFALTGTTNGAGDGSTTFNVVDLRDRVSVGASGTIARGATGGEKTHLLTTAEMPAHTHDISSSGGGSGGNIQPNEVTGAVNGSTHPLTSSTGGGAAHNNMQPYCGVYKLIRVL